MTERNKAFIQNFVDETIMITPKPNACSTVEKKNIYKKCEMKKLPTCTWNDSQRSSTDSLGILSLKDVNLDNNSLEDCDRKQVSNFEEQKQLALELLNRTPAVSKLPSKYLNPSTTIKDIKSIMNRNDSTLSDSDLINSRGLESMALKLQNSNFDEKERDDSMFSYERLSEIYENFCRNSGSKISFTPHENSTPRSSDCLADSSKKLEEINSKLANTDISINEVMKDFLSFNSLSFLNKPKMSEISSCSFEPAEQAIDRLKDDEMAWMKENASLALLNNENLYNMNSEIIANCNKNTGKISEFFLKRSENLIDMSLNPSPEKQYDPVPLLESFEESVCREKIRNDKLEETQERDTINLNIQKMIASDEDTQKIISMVCKNDFKKPVGRSKPSKSQTHNKENNEVNATTKPQENKRITAKYSLQSTPKKKTHKKRTSLTPTKSQNNFTETANLKKYEKKADLRLSDNLEKLSDHNAKSQFIPSNENIFQYTAEVLNNKEIPTKLIQSKLKTPMKNTLQPPKQNIASSIKLTPEKPLSPSSKSSPCGNQTIPLLNDLRSFSPTSYCSGLSDGKSSRASVRSGSSLDTLPDGKLPIESTRTELVWGCVKVGKKSTKEFVLRNRTHQKVRLEASLSGFSFRILTDLDSVTNVQILLQPYESRTINVSFSPTHLGAAVEKLNFLPADKVLQTQYSSRQMIWLYGYGGHTNIELQNVAKDTRGKYWLSLGNISENNRFVKTFEIRNLGSLKSFAFLKIECRGLRHYSNIVLNPNHIILHPNEVISVTITFYPNKDEYKQILESMNHEGIEIAYLSIVSGPESLRGRIRRLKQKVNDQMGIVPDFPIVQNLSVTFPGEKMPQDIRTCKESPASMKELLKYLSHKEIAITLEQDVDQTLTANLPGLNDSSQFLSLCQIEKTMTLLNNTTRKVCNIGIEPDRIFLRYPQKPEDSFFIISENSNEVYFEVAAEDKNLLQCIPESGTVMPNEPMLIRVRCNFASAVKSVNLTKIKVFIENEVAEVDVKIVSK